MALIYANIVTEVLMIFLQAMAYDYSIRYRGRGTFLDQIYFVVASAFLLASMGWAWHFYVKSRNHFIWGLCLFILGSAVIISAVDIERHCGYNSCQKYELKVTIGVVTCINGIFYFFPPRKFSPSPVADVSPVQPQHVIVVDNAGGVMDAPPPYFTGQQEPPPYYFNLQPGAVQIAFQQMPEDYSKPAETPSFSRQT